MTTQKVTLKIDHQKSYPRNRPPEKLPLKWTTEKVTLKMDHQKSYPESWPPWSISRVTFLVTLQSDHHLVALQGPNELNLD